MDERYSNAQLKLVTDSPPAKLENQEWKEIRRNRLINSLNRINFQDGEVVLNFKHTKYDTILSLPAKPQPCLDKYLECSWSEPFLPDHNFENLKFENLYFADGLNQILVEADLVSINMNVVNFYLPESAAVVNSRKVRRHKCRNVSLQLIQNGLIFEGELLTFSPISFSVSIPDEMSFNGQQEINRKSPVDIILIRDNSNFYSGRCDIFRLSDTPEGRLLILKPLNSQIQRFKPKKFRGVRQELNPSPNIIFHHPFAGRRVNLKVQDISGAGFSVEENFANSILPPGMIIPEVNIEFMNGLYLKCKCQVIYRTSHDGETIKCGIAFIDMGLKDQVKLCSFLHQASNENAHVCCKVNIEELWDFFFETGFIYPKKYFYIHSNRKKFDEVYKKLYEQDSDIAINFIYQDKGKVYGHMSMFRFYKKTWVINHHAANSSKRSRAGLVVLEQIGRYINEFHRLPSAKMDYVSCYYRPDNKFPNLVFGGAARNSSNGCTIEQFAYTYINKKSLPVGNLPDDLTINITTKKDLEELTSFYENEFGGLTLKALDLCSNQIDCDQILNNDFLEAGFQRERHLYSLRNKGNLVAVFMVTVTELGMNMSDLTNCIHAFIVDSDNLPADNLYNALSKLSHHYEQGHFPLLIFPQSYSEQNSIPVDKTYNFWVLDVEKSSDEYFTHVERLTKRVKK